MEVQDFAELMVVEGFNDMSDSDFERYMQSQNSPEAKAKAREARARKKAEQLNRPALPGTATQGARQERRSQGQQSRQTQTPPPSSGGAGAGQRSSRGAQEAPRNNQTTPPNQPMADNKSPKAVGVSSEERERRRREAQRNKFLRRTATKAIRGAAKALNADTNKEVPVYHATPIA